MQHTRTGSYQPMHVPAGTHTRRPSEPMPSWLSRTPGTSPRPVRISEPRFARALDLVSASATRLGLGATVVRTPDDALRDTGVRITYQSDKSLKHKPRPTPRRLAPHSPPTSPPLPPLPLDDDEERQLLSESPVTTPRPPRSPAPDPQRTISKRSSLKLPKSIAPTHSSSSSEDPPSVPPLPSHIAASTQPPPFSPVLITEPSLPSPNPEKAIVTLETCTQTYRTTLSTLTSRPSHLAKYLLPFYPPPSPNSIATSSSLYSQSGDPPPLNRILAPASTVHIFLDRSSAPYAHILSYLRQPLIGPESESLPYALQLHNYTSIPVQASSPSVLQSKLDTLIEVRDEAAYLNLEGLHKLCVEEIRNRYNSKPHLLQGPGQGHHMRGLSSSSMQSLHSLQASVYNLQPLQEKAETEAEVDTSPLSDIAHNSNSTSSSIGAGTGPPLNSISSPSTFGNGPPGPSPAAIAIRRKSKQALTSAAASAENIILISKTPPTPQSFDGRHRDELNQSRSSSRSRQTHTSSVSWI